MAMSDPRRERSERSAIPIQRRRVLGASDVESALSQGPPVQCVILPRDGTDPAAIDLAARARADGITVELVGRRKFERLRGNHSDAEILALVGPPVRGRLDDVMSRGGAVWLLTGPAYPGNVGFAIRTAEVSGADGLYVDNDFDHAKRREARRASMRADRFLPIGWESANAVLDAARRAGKRVIGVEDVGSAAPWQVDLTGPLLLVVGAEAEGVPRGVLERCDHVVRIPMAGFIASYNLQAAVAALAAERLRQLEREHS
jgi:23S rRNA (guanosine2251-2'-O)-methyltransferase